MSKPIVPLLIERRRTAMRRSVAVPFLAGVLVALLPVALVFASSPVPVPVAVAQRALTYANPAADDTEAFYETATADVPNADHAFVLLGDVTSVLAGAGYTDPRIAVAQNDLRQAHALLVQAHNLGQQADSMTQAVKRDLLATTAPGITSP